MNRTLKTYRFEYRTLFGLKSVIIKSCTLNRALKKLDSRVLENILCGYSDYKIIPQEYLEKTVDRAILWRKTNLTQ